MKKRKKTRSGMTLIEIIVSLAVLGIMTLLMVRASHSIQKYMLSANNVDRKVSQQAPVAEVKYKDSAYSLHDDVTIQLDIVNQAADGSEMLSGTTAVIKGETFVVVNPTTTTPAVGGEQRIAGDQLNMKFIAFITTTSAPTTTPATTTTATT